MKKILILIVYLVSAHTIFAQSGGDIITVTKATPVPSPTRTNSTSTSTILETIAKNLEKIKQNSVISREDREAAYVGLMEGQRFYLQAINAQSPGGLFAAKEAFRKAVELNPNLAEGYTALAEIAWLSFRVLRVRGAERGKDSDLEETIAAAGAAIKVSPDSFRARQLLAMAFTEKSNLQQGNLNTEFADKAIAEWKSVARIDPRNAEAFAILNLFYEKMRKPTERIEALKNWLAASSPIDSRYYQSIAQTRETLSPDNALLKLGKALLEAGRAAEAIEFLSRAIADNPQNEQATELLREAIESGDFSNSSIVMDALRQVIFANPKNSVLVLLLADLQMRGGKTDEAVKILLEAIAKMPAGEDSAVADLQVKLGDIYLENERYADAAAAFQTALKLRKIESSIVTEEELGFAMNAYEKIVRSYKNANRLPEAKAAIEKAKILLGKDDTFADDLLIDFYRETGKRDEALKLVRERRSRYREDYGLLRLEAGILTEMGRVDEAVALIKPLLNKTSENPSPQYDDFTNYIFMATLYTEAKRGREAIQTANQAFAAARNEEEKQIAKTVLASAQQVSGDFVSAEATLRALLKQTPRNPMALNNLGYFLVERNVKLAEALSLIQQAVEIDPTNPSYLDSLGWAYFKLGKFVEAEKYLKNAARLTSSATTFEHLGDVYQKLNKTELAKANWRKALNLIFDKAAADRLKLKLSR